MKKEKQKETMGERGKTEKFKIERENRRENGRHKREEETANRLPNALTKEEIGPWEAKLRRRRRREAEQ